MKISMDRSAVSAYSGLKQAADNLYSSMNRLSTGHRIDSPGDAPADYGIALGMRFQIRNSQAAHRNLEDARNLINTADAWLQSSHDILHRMAELATSASDSSKSPADIDALDTEFGQLKAELRRIGSEAKYNGIQVAGKDQILSYDQDKETFLFSQLDGTEAYRLSTKVLSGVQGTNQVDFLYDTTKDFTKDANGRYVFYVDSNDNLTKYDIETGTLTRSTIDSADKGLEVDNYGRLWYAAETAPASGVYALRQMDVQSWTQDTSLIDNTDITDLGSKEFKIYENRIYYLDSSDNVVSRSLTKPGDLSIEMAASEHTFTTTAGQFALSEDGQYVADVSTPGSVRVTNLATQSSNTFSVDAAAVITDLTFSVDGGEIAFIDSTEGSIHRIQLELGDTPTFSTDQTLHLASGATGYAGLSLDGGSHRSRLRIQQGPDAGQQSFMVAGDVRLHTLGLSRVSIHDAASARQALDAVQEASHRVSVQRSVLGAQEGRLEKTHHAMSDYIDNMSMAESSIRDVDIARETSLMMEWQVRHQMTTALLAQANQQSQNILRLLQG